MSSTGADLVLQNAEIITCDRKTPGGNAVAIKGSRIINVGDIADMPINSKTRLIDCQGFTLVPGFIDSHCHIFAFARKLISLDLSPASVGSIEEIKKIIHRAAESSPRGSWITGTDYNEFYLREGRHPTRWDLDEAAPDHPVIIYHRSLHACVLNSLALKITGITGETEEPPGGMIDRDLETGEPNGILFEMNSYIRSRIPESLTKTEIEQKITLVNQIYLSHGITSLTDASVSNDLEQWYHFKKMKEGNRLQSRLCVMPGCTFLADFVREGLITGSGDEAFRTGSLKIVLSEATGHLNPPQDELNHLVQDASRAGFQVAIHAVEKNTAAAAIQAFESVNRNMSTEKMRFRLEHCSECPPDLRDRLANLHAVIVSQPPFVYYHGERYLAQVPTETRQWLYPFNSLLRNGLIVAAS
ncbi:MAG: amidohydrolase family protein, partial [Dehalococcoidales bacterium]|nr:amidohydrolase family protein [Dehalococcoidales bacterium]